MFGINIIAYQQGKNSKVWDFIPLEQNEDAEITIHIGIYNHCFFIKDIELFSKNFECLGCHKRFTRSDNLKRDIAENACQSGNTKIISLGEKWKPILGSAEKVFYPNTQFSVKACGWIEKAI